MVLDMAKNVNPKQTFGDLEPSAWPGERLNLPETGSLSIARIGRRIGAIMVDWIIATIISQGISRMIAPDSFADLVPTITLAVFAALQIIFIPTIGGSIGHRIFGLRIINLNGGWVGLWRPAVRTLLLLLVIPVIVWDSDQRGFHDKISGTALVIA